MKDRDISFSGPTYVAIRSAKHDSSTAASHQYDLDEVFQLAEFESSVKGKDGRIKPLLFVGVDGGPDEAPSSTKALDAWVYRFKKHQLDGLFVFANAPGLSAYNKVERRMAPLSKMLSGIILPLDVYGSHLDSSNKTVDEDLERKNFKAAGEVLAEVWSETTIDEFPVVARFQEPGSIVSLATVDPAWSAAHVRQSRYLLQIVKCNKRSCCSAPRVQYELVLGGRFLPPPIPLERKPDGPKVDSSGKFGSLFQNVCLANSTSTKVRHYDNESNVFII